MPVQVSPGTIEEKTIRTRVISADADEKAGRKWPPVWEWLPSVTPEQWKNGNVEIALYRYDPVTEKRQAVEKFNEAIDEFTIKRKFGGGHFEMWVKVDGQLRYNQDIYIEGEPLTPGPSASEPMRTGLDGTAAVQLEAMRMATNPTMMQAMMQMYLEASKHAMEMIRAQMPAQQSPIEMLRAAKELFGPTAPPTNPLNDLMMTTILPNLLQRAMTPGDPVENVKGIAALMEAMKGLSGGNVKTDLASTIVGNLPGVLDRVVSGVREYRLASEASERTIRLQRGLPSEPTPINVEAHRVPNGEPGQPPAPNPSPTSGAAPDAQPAIAHPGSIPYLLLKLEAGIQNEQTDGADIYEFIRSYATIGALNQGTWNALVASKESCALCLQNLYNQTFGEGNPHLAAIMANPRLPALLDQYMAAVEADRAEAPPPANSEPPKKVN